jgi:hypothetical protein
VGEKRERRRQRQHCSLQIGWRKLQCTGVGHIKPIKSARVFKQRSVAALPQLGQDDGHGLLDHGVCGRCKSQPFG